MSDLQSIVQRLGGDFRDGGRSASVPGPGHSPRDRSLSLTIGEGGRLVWHSFAGDDAADVAAHLGLEGPNARTPSPRREARRPAQRAKGAEKVAYCRAVWAGSLSASGTIVEVYLRGRGIRGPIPPCIRFNPRAPLGYDQQGRQPAMVIAVADAQGDLSGVHVTALLPDGSGKAHLDNPRRMLGEVHGAAARLAELPADRALVVAEGVETALSFRDLTSACVWSCLSAPGLAAFTFPGGLRDLTIAADADEAGIAAAMTLAARVPAGCACRIIAAPPGLDWNDVLGASQ